MTPPIGTVETFDVRGIRTSMGLTTDQFGVVLDTASKTIERWEKTGIPEATPVRTLEEIHQLKDLAELGVIVYGKNFKDFLRTPVRALDGKAPWRLLAAGDIKPVFQLLVAAYEGDGF